MASVQLALNKVSVSFEGTPLLGLVDLEVVAGECLVLVGPSGHGKSVLLKLFAGLLIPTSGSVLIAGRPLNSASLAEQELLVLKMGMLFQKNALFDSLTVAENIAFPLREKSRLQEEEIAEHVRTALTQVGLENSPHLYPDQISGGMQKRLGIARALALDPEIVLYDDPTAGLDPITSRMIIELILRLKNERGATVVAVTNDMTRAYQMADRIAMVVDGELIVTGNKAQTQAHKDPRVVQFVRGDLNGPLTEKL